MVWWPIDFLDGCDRADGLQMPQGYGSDMASSGSGWTPRFQGIKSEMEVVS